MSTLETSVAPKMPVTPGQVQLQADIEAFNKEVDALLRQVEQRRNTFTEYLFSTMERADPARAAHCRRVSQYAEDTAAEIGLDENEQKLIALAALLHDFGALNAPVEILGKQDALTQEERQTLRAYVYEGAHMLSNVHYFEPIVTLISCHYEWFSGEGGFPGKLHGENIPLGARIIAVANAYDALINRRPGHKPISSQDALIEISARTGTQYDPDVVEAFIRVV